jgi:hypothetical protein
MKTKITLMAAVLALGACASHPYNIGWKNEAEMRDATTATLCKGYAWGGSKPPIVAELERRKAFTPDEWAAIGQQAVKPGMSTDAAQCAWGPPREVERVEAGGERWVYWRGKSFIATDGRVSAVTTE